MSDPNACAITGYTLEANHILHVTGNDDIGNTGTNSLDLDSVIGNVNGALSWGGQNFSPTAQNVVLSADGKTLDADLPDSNGQLAHSQINIEHKISLDGDGNLQLISAFGVPHSTAHAIADTNDAADQAIHAQVIVPTGDGALASVTTVKGDAANYHPPDVVNAPAPMWEIFEFAVELAFHIVHIVHEKKRGCTIL